MKRLFVIIVFILIADVLLANGVLIKIQGSVQYLRKGRVEWIMAETGQTVFLGDRLRSLSESYAQVIFNGRLLNVPENSELELKNTYSDVNEFLDSLKMKRRSLPAIRDDISHELWLKLLADDQFLLKNIDNALELIERFYEEKSYNRMISLLIKLDEKWPDCGFSPTLEEVKKKYGNPIRWTVFKYENGRRKAVQANAIQDKDLFQIGYRTQNESYLYMIATDAGESTLIFPQDDNAHLSPDTLMLVPNNQAIIAKAGSYFWALTCYGPVDLSESIFEQVTQIAQSRKLTMADIKNISPTLCRPTVFFEACR